MKNGRAMKGHRRTVRPVGTRTNPKKPPSGGYEVGCLCGWSGGSRRTFAEAKAAYREHLDQEIDRTPRECRRCLEVKLPSAFRDDWSKFVCRRCYSEIGNEWSRENAEASARHKRNWHLLNRFGITIDEAETILDDQGGVCAICEEEIEDPRGFSPHVDHDHATGEVRGVLCFHCNAGLGQFKDDPERLRAAIVYLNSPNPDPRPGA